VLLVALTATALGAAGSGLGARVRPAAVVNVTAGKPTEYAFTLKPRSVKRGKVRFVLVNAGRRAHGFSINGRATKVIKPHATATLSVVFKRPGRYVYECVATEEPGDFGPGYNDVPAQCVGGVFTVR
jgi:plastocyanin